MKTDDLIGEIAKRTGVKITPDDPAFIFLEAISILNESLVSQNQAAIGEMENQTAQLVDNVSITVNAVNQSVSLLTKRINAVADARTDDKIKLAIAMAGCVLGGLAVGIGLMLVI